MFGLLHHLFHPTHCYALCTVARSGAHLLSAGLRQTHLAGRPLQYFHQQLAMKYAARYGFDPARHFAQYVRGIVGAAATPNAFFGLRIEAWDLERVIAQLRESRQFGDPKAREIDLLRSAFPRLRCIQLTREDKLRQAISKARAMQTDLWVVRGGESAAREPAFDPELIAHCLLSAQRSEEIWAEFFQRNEIEPLAITYEELCADYPATITRVLDFLRIRAGRHLSLGPPKTVRQADAITEEWVQRYTQLQTDKITACEAERGG
jgi:trehalose 2-sulfotransferase